MCVRFVPGRAAGGSGPHRRRAPRAHTAPPARSRPALPRAPAPRPRAAPRRPPPPCPRTRRSARAAARTPKPPTRPPPARPLLPVRPRPRRARLPRPFSRAAPRGRRCPSWGAWLGAGAAAPTAPPQPAAARAPLQQREGRPRLRLLVACVGQAMPRGASRQLAAPAAQQPEQRAAGGRSLGSSGKDISGPPPRTCPRGVLSCYQPPGSSATSPRACGCWLAEDESNLARAVQNPKARELLFHRLPHRSW